MTCTPKLLVAARFDLFRPHREYRRLLNRLVGDREHGIPPERERVIVAFAVREAFRV